ncbi:hypothetical protein WDW86_03970, partial [Bdellovibrionota bacterium FG-2]
MKHLLIVLIGLGVTGCAHYSLPVGELESPETLGTGQTASMDLVGMLGGPDLIALSFQPPTDSPDPSPKESPPNPCFA